MERLVDFMFLLEALAGTVAQLCHDKESEVPMRLKERQESRNTLTTCSCMMCAGKVEGEWMVWQWEGE